MDLKQVYEERRSVNFFDTTKTIDRSLLRQIYELARLAPSSWNLQPWKIIVVSETENKKKLRAAAHGQAKIEEAPLTLIVLGDREGYLYMPVDAQDMAIKGYIGEDQKERLLSTARDQYSGQAQSEAFALRNAGLFAMSFMYAARYYGVDTHPMDGFDAPSVRSLFNIPERYIIAMLIAAGYRDTKKTLLSRLDRKDLEQVCVEEGFLQQAVTR
ncbi:MAG: nitroreductase family protein [Deltaproteobacteria bacterium]